MEVLSDVNRSRSRTATFALMASILAACTGAPSTTVPSPTPASATGAVPTVTVGASSRSLPPTTAAPAFTATSEPATSAPAGAITIKMGPGARPIFAPSMVSAGSGSIALYVTNADPGAAPAFHDFRIGPGPKRGIVGASTRALRPGEAVLLTLSDVAPGTYTFWCEILRHWEFGMVGTLTVAP